MDNIKKIDLPSACFPEIETEINWLKEVLVRRSQLSSADNIPEVLTEIAPPDIADMPGTYGSLIARYNFGFSERVILMMTLAPHLYPKLLEIFVDKQSVLTGWGGKITKDNQYFLPTAETLLYTLAGKNLEQRIRLMQCFNKDHIFYKENLLTLEESDVNEPELSGILKPSPDLIDLILRGHVRKPDLRPDFPAKLLSTDMNWEDIVLPAPTLNQLNDIGIWLQHHHLLAGDKSIGRKLKPGFKALFYGPPGTGKTLSASLIGKKTGRDVYRIDLSTIVSKYIGETEKNLARLFDRAERKDWILFFDEADALFGKRTNVNDSHDRYANQEVSYLLQRIEYHEGLVILASNMKNNIDPAFLRRFQSIIYFPAPKAEERLLLWQKAFSSSVPVHNEVPLAELARRYELSGSLILNIVSYSTLKAIHEKSPVVTGSMLQEGISRELAKEGRST